jgi:hypothetical protein
MIDVFNFYQINMQKSFEKSFYEETKTNTEEGYLQLFSEVIQFMSTKDDQINYLNILLNRRELVEFLIKNKDVFDNIESILIEYKNNEYEIEKFFKDEKKNRNYFAIKLIKGGKFNVLFNGFKKFVDSFSKKHFAASFLTMNILTCTLSNILKNEDGLKLFFKNHKNIKNIFSIK